MVPKIVLLVALAAVAVNARRAPHADYVENLIKSSGARFSSDILEDSLLDAPGLIAKYGYPIEIHHVTTSDGYILEMHRIPHGRDEHNTRDPSKPIAFIMHGLLSSSADFIVKGPGNALAYVLAEAGYDVWLGNARGNFYSRNHLSLNPSSTFNQNFWKFSWDEIGNFDLPAFIDYILETTGQSKLHYIGHSQGGTTFLVLNSLRPEYNEKFISFQGLAPASFMNNNNVSMFQSLAPFENVIESTAYLLGFGEVFGDREFIAWFKANYCDEGSIFADFCSSTITGLNEREFYNTTMVPLFLSHVPAGASIRQIAHYGQVIRFEAFRRYNHNGLTNMIVYGSWNPPEYDLSKVTAPSYLHYGASDKEVNYKDLHILASRLPNVIGKFRIERETFNHYDFIWGIDARQVLYDKLVYYMKDAESRQ
ncbi:lipase 3-like [Trichoplusia ni]|uniref:Lipase n=1 Tax=Trichoplusia ni TaxID=7111 RepID=A0A7E5VAR9_TRINI|nr:lipase 3-like [Trichoplusia ni]